MTKALMRWIKIVLITLPLVFVLSCSFVWGLFWLFGDVSFANMFSIADGHRDVFYITSLSTTIFIYVGLTLCRIWNRRLP